MFENEIRKEMSSLSFDKKDDFETFLSELEGDSLWILASSGSLRLLLLNAKSGLTACGNWDYTHKDILSEIEKEGGLVLSMETSLGKKYIPVNPNTAAFTIDDRAGVRSKLLADYFNKGHMAEYVKMVNEGLQFYNERVKILVRGGRVLAVHTAKYCDFVQEKLYEIANTHMAAYKGSSFIRAGYCHERTYADYAVCSSKDAFLEKYADAWRDAGLPERLLERSYPILTFSTGDTGKYPVSITPKLIIGKGVFPLGTAISIKHTASITVKGALEEKANLAFANMKEGLTTVEEMLKLELYHPYAAFVKAATKVGITSKAKAAITAALENFKDNYIQGVDTVTAFDVYYSICEMVHFKEFADLSDPTKFQVMESFNRLLQIKWKDLDFTGREVF